MAPLLRYQKQCAQTYSLPLFYQALLHVQSDIHPQYTTATNTTRNTSIIMNMSMNAIHSRLRSGSLRVRGSLCTCG